MNQNVTVFATHKLSARITNSRCACIANKRNNLSLFQPCQHCLLSMRLVELVITKLQTLNLINFKTQLIEALKRLLILFAYRSNLQVEL